VLCEYEHASDSFVFIGYRVFGTGDLWPSFEAIAPPIKAGWRGNFFWHIRIGVSQNLPESNKSSYWARDVVKNTVKSWNSQMNFHSVEIFPRDVNCRKRHHSGSTLLHMRACAIGSQSPTSTALSHFWLLGSKYEHEMDPKTKTNTYEFTEFSLVLTPSLPRKWVILTRWPKEFTHLFRKRFFSLSLCSLLIAKQVLLLSKQASSMFAT